MPEPEADKMIGGYASGMLTAYEQRVLFEAALRDQDVFDALVQDQALKELLDDPVTRRRLIDAMAPASTGPARGWMSSARAWLKRPAHLALAGSLATALLVSVVVLEVYRQASVPPPEEVPSTSLRKAERPAAEAPPGTPKEQAEADRARTSPEPPPRAKTTRPGVAAWHVTQSFSKQSTPGPARSLFFTGHEQAESGSGAVAQEERSVSPSKAPGRARDRVLRRSEQAAATVGPLSLRYRIVDPGAGDVIDLEQGATIQPQGALELRVEVNQTGHLYVLEQPRDGEGRLLFPELPSGALDLRGKGSQALVQPGISYAVALGARLAALRDQGPYRVLLIFSRRPLFEGPSAPSASPRRPFMDELRRMSHTLSLVTERVPGQGGGMYVANPSTTPGAAVAATIIFAPR